MLKKTLLYLIIFYMGFHTSYSIYHEKHLLELEEVREKSEAIAFETKKALVNAALDKMIDNIRIACKNNEIVIMQNLHGKNKLAMTCGDRRTLANVSYKG